MSNNNNSNNSPDPNAIPANTGATGGAIPISQGTGTTGNATWITTTYPFAWFGITPNGVDTPPLPVKKKDSRDGCDCTKCKDFYPYAEPNQEDGTLICFKCRMGW